MLQTFNKSFLFIAAVVLLAGCQGKNPFDRSNDPTKDYSNLEQDSSEYRPLENTELERYKNQVLPEIQNLKNQLAAKEHQLQAEAAERQNAQSACGRVYDMEIEGSEGGRLDFIENVQKSYKITVRSYLTSKYTLQLEKAPESSMKISPTDIKGEWTVSWQPSSGLINERESFYTGALKIAFVPQAENTKTQACLNPKFVEDFSVTVALDDTQPVLTVEDSHQELLSKNDYTVLHLLIKDPAATDKLLPVVSAVKPETRSDINLPALCDAPKKTSTDKIWSVDCAVYFSPLEKKIEAAKNGDIIETVVAFKAVSARTGRRTPVIPKVLKIKVDEPSKILPPAGPNLTTYKEGEYPIPTPRPEYKKPDIEPNLTRYEEGEYPIPTPRPDYPQGETQ